MIKTNIIDKSIRLFISFFIFVYGISKIIHLQFETYNLNNTITKLSSGKEIVWFFFSYSYGYSFIIGILQIMGGILLSTNKYFIFGYFLLTPIFANIILIDLFYNISALKDIIYLSFLLSISVFLNRIEILEIISLTIVRKKSKNNNLILIIFCFIVLFSIGALLRTIN